MAGLVVYLSLGWAEADSMQIGKGIQALDA
jgi:hypothetical protein